MIKIVTVNAWTFYVPGTVRDIYRCLLYALEPQPRLALRGNPTGDVLLRGRTPNQVRATPAKVRLRRVLTGEIPDSPTTFGWDRHGTGRDILERRRRAGGAGRSGGRFGGIELQSKSGSPAFSPTGTSGSDCLGLRLAGWGRRSRDGAAGE